MASRQEIHDVNNQLNKITITCGGMKDILETEPLDNMAQDKLKQLTGKFIKAFSDMEQAAIDASNILFKA